MNNLLTNSQPNATNTTAVCTILADTPEKLAGLSAGMTEDQLRQPLAPGERSMVEILAHLLNSEARISDAIYNALLSRDPILPSIHPERDLGRLLRFDRFEFHELLRYFRLRRAVLVGVLDGLYPEQWLRSVREEDKGRKESVYWKARVMAVHELEHTEEIRKRLAAAPAPSSG